MKKILLFLSLLLAIGCHKNDDMNITSSDEIDVEFAYFVEPMADQTRLLSDVADVNLYVVSEAGEVYRKYTTGDDVLLKVKPGRYTIYALANYHKDLGVQTKESLEALELTRQDFDYSMTKRSLIMTYKEINVDLVRPQHLNINLKRNVAKIQINVNNLDPSLQLKSFQLKNIPIISKMWESAELSPSDAHYFGEMGVIPIEGMFSKTFYLPENKQGYNLAISDQKDKSKANAPTYATYVHLIAEDKANPTHFVTYDVYLGENETNSFNTFRNTPFGYEINVLGRNEIDTRVKVYDVKLTADATEKSGYIGDYIPFSLTASDNSEDQPLDMYFQKPADFNGELKWNNEPVTATRANFSAESGAINKLEIMSWKVDDVAVVTTATNRMSQRASVTTSVKVTKKPDPILKVNIDPEKGSVAVYLAGSSTPTNQRTFKDGDFLKLVATSKSQEYFKFEFKEWLGDELGTSPTLEFKIGEDNVTVDVVFKRLEKVVFRSGCGAQGYTKISCEGEVHEKRGGVHRKIFDDVLDVHRWDPLQGSVVTSTPYIGYFEAGAELRLIPKIKKGSWKFHYWVEGFETPYPKPPQMVLIRDFKVRKNSSTVTNLNEHVFAITPDYSN